METSRLRTLKVMPRNPNKIVRSWIRLRASGGLFLSLSEKFSYIYKNATVKKIEKLFHLKKKCVSLLAIFIRNFFSFHSTALYFEWNLISSFPMQVISKIKAVHKWSVFTICTQYRHKEDVNSLAWYLDPPCTHTHWWLCFEDQVTTGR